MARRVEGAIQLVDTLLGVLDKREQVLLNEDESMQKEINISLLECLMAAAEALADLPEEAIPESIYEYMAIFGFRPGGCRLESSTIPYANCWELSRTYLQLRQSTFKASSD